MSDRTQERLLRAERYDQAALEYLAGADLAYLARDLGVSKNSVMRAMRKRGLRQTQQARDVWRFWHRVHKTETCWLWTGPLDDGYGQIHIGGIKKKAHRVAYEWANGPIPAGLQLDHLCRTRNCVRPDHLEAVTFLENMRRAARAYTQCIHGHGFTPDNTSISVRGDQRKRSCKTCIRERSRERRSRERQIRQAG